MIKADAFATRYMLDHLVEMISEERWQKFHEVLDQRTRWITVVLEDIFQPHNASAVIRTCELMGVQDLHIIENQNLYEINPDIVVGSNKWLTMRKYNQLEHNTLNCFDQLRQNGYRIVATSPHKNDCLISELPLNQKTAIVLGTEGPGLSDVAMQNADAFVKIPMHGFTESYNISVSAALTMYELCGRLRREVTHWQLTEQEREMLLLDYALKSIKNPRTFIRRMKMELEGHLEK
ncbi:MAG: TrmH family RNA methyltransferase [Bacteroidales bacterium]